MAGPNTASFTLQTPALQMELAAQLQARAQAEQELQQLQLQEDKGDNPMATGRLLVPNLTPLLRALKMAKLREASKVAEAKAYDAQGKWQEQEQAAVADYLKKKSGSVDQVAGPPTEDGAYPTRVTAGNPQAYLEGEVSPSPAVKALAKNDREAYLKLFEELVKKASVSSGVAAMQQGNKVGLLKAAPKLHFVDGGVAQEEEGQAPKWLTSVTQESLRGDLYNRSASGKLSAADQGAPAKPVGQSAVMEFVKGMPDKEKEAQTALSAYNTAEQALAELPKAQVGAGSEAEQWVRSFLARYGIQGDAATPTAVLQAKLAKLTLDESGGKLGAGFSNADRDFMQQMVAGSTATQESIERILAIRMAVAYKRLQAHNDKVGAIGSEADRLNKITGTDVNPSGDLVGKLYKVQMPGVSTQFRTMEAAASFESALSGRPYAEVLAGLKAEKARNPAFKDSYPGYGKAADKALNNAEEARKKARMEALGLPYYPPVEPR